MRFVPALLTAFILLTVYGNSANAGSRHIPLSDEFPEITSIGSLDWRGGLELTADGARFGGLSAIEVDHDGRLLTALTDRGDWLRFALDYDRRGYLAAAHLLSQSPLNNVDGAPLRRKSDRDSESLARLADGGHVVSFEGRHRLLFYPASDPPFSATPVTLIPPAGLRRARSNGGIEALTLFAENWLFALGEKIELADGTLLGWAGDGRHWRALHYKPVSMFRPTGATTLPDGDVLLLERRFSLLGGFAARLVRLAQNDIVRAATDFSYVLQGREVARLEPPLSVDNFEGVSARRADSGETLVYIVSDDNFLALQRTLLMLFVLRDDPPKKSQS